MSRDSRREVIRARQRALRQRLERRPTKRRPRRWPWLVLLLILLLLLARLCSCDEPDPEVGEVPATGVGAAGEPPPAPAPPLPAIERRARPAYENDAPQPLAWLDDFRLQVAARSPRLAACFVGAEQPGALKWTASVEPGSGRVSDHVLEPVLETVPLTADQRACVLGVLSDPPYHLDVDERRSTPSRVGIAIEF